MIWWVIAIALLVLVTIQMMLVVASSVRHSLHQKNQRRRDAIQFRSSLRISRRKKVSETAESLTWTDWRKFKVVRKDYDSADQSICTLRLRAHDRRKVASFRPGQYLTIQLQIPGQVKPVVRCFSLSGAQDPFEYQISVKRIAPTDDRPDVHPGLVSNYLHDHVSSGDIFDVKAPKGDFYLDVTRPRPIVLIGGGIGVTPVLSMLNTVARQAWIEDVWFFYGVRNGGEHLMKQHMQQLVQTRSNINYRACYSSPTETDLYDVDYHHQGRITIEYLKSMLRVNNFDFYLCGPGNMMADLREDLLAWDVSEDNVHMETFGPSAAPKRKPDPKATGPSIVFRRSNRTVQWDASYKSIWEFANALDVPITSGCRSGKCGECKIAVLAGDVSYASEPSYECESGSCLTCCCTPKGDITLDA